MISLKEIIRCAILLSAVSSAIAFDGFQAMNQSPGFSNMPQGSPANQISFPTFDNSAAEKPSTDEFGCKPEETSPQADGIGQIQPEVFANMSPFASSLLQAVSSSDILPNLFNIFSNPIQAGIMYYDNSLYYGQQLGVPNAQSKSAAEAIAQAAAKTFRSITPQSFFLAFSNTIERFLSSMGMLTPDTISPLVNKFVHHLEDTVRMYGPLESPEQSVRARTNGSLAFFRSLNLPSDKIKETMSIFTDEINNAGKRS